MHQTALEQSGSSENKLLLRETICTQGSENGVQVFTNGEAPMGGDVADLALPKL